jgi:Raf kinase inhibitor-like YbhB/YbcL family protein
MTRMTFTIDSPVFSAGQHIPMRHTCDDRDLSPPLVFRNLPPGTASLVLIVEDPDAPSGPFTHWVLFDIPAETEALPEAAAGIGVAGRNDFQADRWGGPCPPPNAGDHRYVFTLYAIDVASLGLPHGTRRDAVERAMADHILQTASLTGRYQRRPGT